MINRKNVNRAQAGRLILRVVLWAVCSLTLLPLSLAAQTADTAQSLEAEPAPITAPVTMVAGLYAGYGLNMLHGNLSANQLPGVIPGTGECGSFESGDGSGVAFGGLFEYRLTSLLFGSLRVEYSNRSGAMRYSCVDPADTRLPDGSLVTALTDHVGDISIGTLGFYPGVRFQPFDFPLLFSPGAAILLGLGGDYTLTEEIVTPQTAEFVSGGQTREYGTGTLAEDGNGVAFGLYGAVGYQLKAGTDWQLRPEVSLVLPLSDDFALGGIRSTGVRFTLGITRTFRKEEPAIVPVIPPQVVAEAEEDPPQPLPPLRVFIETDNGSGWSQSPLIIRRSIPVKTRLLPLLPYIFFDNRSGDLPERYVRLEEQNAEAFSEENLRSHSILDTYSHVLNIVGSRMKEHPEARLTITGTAPDVAEGNPSKNLAGMRAKVVEDYLSKTWGITKDRLKVVLRHDPEVPTNPETPEGRAENRRVELSSEHPNIFAPLIFTDTTETQQIGKFRIVAEGQSVDSLKSLMATITSVSKGVRLTTLVDRGTPNAMTSKDIQLIPAVFRTAEDTILVELTPDPDNGRIEEKQLALPVRRDDTYVPVIASGEYSLILFDAATAGLRNAHLQTIDTVVGLLPPLAKVEVFGYTDFLGDSTQNRELSEQRANRVAEQLIGRVHNLHSHGMGEDTETFKVLGFPEERMYARRVVIRVNGESEK